MNIEGWLRIGHHEIFGIAIYVLAITVWVAMRNIYIERRLDNEGYVDPAPPILATLWTALLLFPPVALMSVDFPAGLCALAFAIIGAFAATSEVKVRFKLKRDERKTHAKKIN